MSRIFVTGSESFIGREFVGLAIAQGHTVATIDTLRVDRRGHVVGDIRDRALASYIPAGTESIVHLAAVSRDLDCRNDPRLAFDVNIMGTQNVLDAAVACGVRQIIFASSEWVYGDVVNDDVQTERSPIDVTRISGEYAMSKVVGERLVAMAVARGLGAGTVLRFGIVYGPRLANWSAVESIFAKIATHDVVTVGSASTARRFIHVADIAAGIAATIGRLGFETFNLSGDALVTLRELFDVGGGIHARHPQLEQTNPGAVSVRNPANDLAKATLDWRPQFDVKRGLQSLVGRLEATVPALAVR